MSMRQAGLVEARLPGVRLWNAHSCKVADTVVLEVEHDQRRYIVKAADPFNHHMSREMEAHRLSTGALVSLNRAPKLIKSDQPQTSSSRSTWKDFWFEARQPSMRPIHTIRQGILLVLFTSTQGKLNRTMSWWPQPRL